MFLISGTAEVEKWAAEKLNKEKDKDLIEIHLSGREIEIVNSLDKKQPR